MSLKSKESEWREEKEGEENECKQKEGGVEGGEEWGSR